MKKLDAFFGSAFHKWVFLICLFVAVGLIVTSFFIPPLAVVDGSVLAAVGELFAFAALAQIVRAVEKGKTASITRGNTSLTIGDTEPAEMPENEEMEEID